MSEHMELDFIDPPIAVAQRQQQVVRDWDAGEDAVKAASTRYLPKPAGMTAANYEGVYLDRAVPPAVIGPTSSYGVGIIMRKSAQWQAPDALMTGWNRSMSRDGLTQVQVTRQLLRDVFVPGHSLWLLDLVAETQAPVAIRFDPSQLMQVDETIVDGFELLKRVVLKYQRPDPLKRGSTIEGRLVLQLDESGFYESERFERTGRAWVSVETTHPDRRGERLREIPLVAVGATGESYLPGKPPLYDLTRLANSAYKSSADLEYGLHLASSPQPYITGYRADEGGSLAIGPSSIWIFPDKDTRVGFNEFSGQGLEPIRKSLADKYESMVALGAKLLDSGRPVRAETATAVRLRGIGERSVLSVVSASASSALTRIARLGAWWAGYTETPDDPEIFVKLNEDFLDDRIDADLLRSLIVGNQAGLVSRRTVAHNLERGELLPWSPDEELQAIVAEEPAL